MEPYVESQESKEEHTQGLFLSRFSLTHRYRKTSARERKPGRRNVFYFALSSEEGREGKTSMPYCS